MVRWSGVFGIQWFVASAFWSCCKLELTCPYEPWWWSIIQWHLCTAWHIRLGMGISSAGLQLREASLYCSLVSFIGSVFWDRNWPLLMACYLAPAFVWPTESMQAQKDVLISSAYKSDSDPVLRNLEHCDGSSTIFPQIVHLSPNNTNVILKRWNKQVFPVWIFFSELWSVHSCLKRNEKWCHLACLNRVISVKTRKSYAQTG